jgi:hypothetical protein
MPRQNNRLSPISVAKKPAGFHPDGHGLYLAVSPAGARSWILRYMLRGKSRDMGLGPYPGVSLSDARMAADTARTLCRAGVDPIKQREDDLYRSYNPKVRDQCVDVCIKCDHGNMVTCSTSCMLKGAR